jgi:hypothetical protein
MRAFAALGDFKLGDAVEEDAFYLGQISGIVDRVRALFKLLESDAERFYRVRIEESFQPHAFDAGGGL